MHPESVSREKAQHCRSFPSRPQAAVTDLSRKQRIEIRRMSPLTIALDLVAYCTFLAIRRYTGNTARSSARRRHLDMSHQPLRLRTPSTVNPARPFYRWDQQIEMLAENFSLEDGTRRESPVAVFEDLLLPRFVHRRGAATSWKAHNAWRRGAASSQLRIGCAGYYVVNRRKYRVHGDLSSYFPIQLDGTRCRSSESGHLRPKPAIAG